MIINAKPGTKPARRFRVKSKRKAPAVGDWIYAIPEQEYKEVLRKKWLHYKVESIGTDGLYCLSLL